MHINYIELHSLSFSKTEVVLAKSDKEKTQPGHADQDKMEVSVEKEVTSENVDHNKNTQNDVEKGQGLGIYDCIQIH